jgi:cell wall-associated NlpC family hydrolase
MGARATLVLLVVTVAAGCGSTAGVRGPAPFPLAKRPGSPGDTAVSASPVPPPASGAGLALLDTALALLGTSYRLGGQDPASGFDCSGLVRYVFAQHAIDVPRTVTEQFAVGRVVAPGEVRAGDLLFFTTTSPGPTHVGIALGPVGQGEFVHAPGTGGAVRIERFDTPYWRARWLGAKRLTP